MSARVALLALALAVAAAGGAGAARAAEDGSDRQLDAALAEAEDLRVTDPPAFLARMQGLEQAPPSTSRAQRERLAFLATHREVLEGRIPTAIDRAELLAREAEDPALRVRASLLVVNLQAGTRQFESGLRRLSGLLEKQERGALPDSVLGEDVLRTAAIFYNELGQPALTATYAEPLLGAQNARNRCYGHAFLQRARQEAADPAQVVADFEAAERACEAVREPHAYVLNTLSWARFLQGREGDAAALAFLEPRMARIAARSHPQLVADSEATRAEMLLALGRLDAAVEAAREAVAQSAELPTGAPMARAQRVLYAIALQRGDQAAALGHLQRHVEAQRAGFDEQLGKERALLTIEHEARQREQALLLAEARSAALAADAARAEGDRRRDQLLLAGLGVTILAALGWVVLVVRDEARFRRMAGTDGLTGFANRLGFHAAAGHALHRARRKGHPSALVVFDLDHFKRVNDAYGHLAGDAVLRAISAAIRELPQGRGVVGRIGGEEFAVLLEGASAQDARRFAEACREAIAAARTEYEGQPLRVTASFGIAGGKVRRLDELMVRGDRALYRAKHNGRDQVCVEDEAA